MIEGLVLLDMASVIALLFVVLIGLPHGAFDGAIANHLVAGRSFVAAAKFIDELLRRSRSCHCDLDHVSRGHFDAFPDYFDDPFWQGRCVGKIGASFHDADFTSWRLANFWHYLFPAIKRHPAIRCPDKWRFGSGNFDE